MNSVGYAMVYSGKVFSHFLLTEVIIIIFRENTKQNTYCSPNQKIWISIGVLYGGRWWIRTTEGIASRFTVCPLWPLGKSPILS